MSGTAPLPRVTMTAEGFTTSVAGMAAMREALQRTPDALRPQVRRALRTTTAVIVADAKRRAGWSSRVPRAISSRIGFAGKRAGVRITVRAASAPHARPYEGLMARARDGRRIGFRHPVYGEGGNRRSWTWINQPFRPFLAPAVEAGTPGVEKALLGAVDDVLRRNGF